MIDRLLGKFESIVMVVIIAIITCYIFVNVIARYVFDVAFASAAEISGFLLVWLSLLAAASAFRFDMHSGIDLAVRFLPRSLRRMEEILVDAVMIGYFIFLGYSTVETIQLYIKTGHRAPVSQLPMWVVMLGILLGIVMCCIRIGQHLIRRIKGEKLQ